MKIGVLTPGTRPLPGGGKSIFPTGFLAVKIAEELKKRGHQVDVYASDDSTVDANLVSLGLKSVFDDKLREENPLAYNESIYKYCLMLASAVIEDSSKYDIIHAHDFRQLIFFSRLSSCPIVYTYHGALEDDIKTDLDKARNARFFQDNFFVAISQKQRELAKKYFNFTDVVYNGVQTDLIPFNENGSDGLLFVGRLITKKRPDLAIKIATGLEKKITVIGTKHPPQREYDYYDHEIEPFTKNPLVNFLGFVEYPAIFKNYGEAKALLFPIEWEEPFGLVMTEAMASGTPVIAFNRGSVSEVIVEGKTGYIIEPGDYDGFKNAVSKIYSLNGAEYRQMRQNCREHVEKSFSFQKMVNGYEAVYQKIIESKRS